MGVAELIDHELLVQKRFIVGLVTISGAILLRWQGYLKPEHSLPIARLTFNLCMPCMLFSKIWKSELAPSLWRAAVVGIGISAAQALVVRLLARWVPERKAGFRGQWIYNMTGYNVGFAYPFLFGAPGAAGEAFPAVLIMDMAGNVLVVFVYNYMVAIEHSPLRSSGAARPQIEPPPAVSSKAEGLPAAAPPGATCAQLGDDPAFRKKGGPGSSQRLRAAAAAVSPAAPPCGGPCFPLAVGSLGSCLPGRGRRSTGQLPLARGDEEEGHAPQQPRAQPPERPGGEAAPGAPGKLATGCAVAASEEELGEEMTCRVPSDLSAYPGTDAPLLDASKSQLRCRTILIALMTSLPFMSELLGLVVNLSTLRLPSSMDAVLESIGEPFGVLLFTVIGINLVWATVKPQLGDVLKIVAARLALSAALAAPIVLFGLLPPGPMQIAALLVLCCPVSGMAMSYTLDLGFDSSLQAALMATNNMASFGILWALMSFA